MIEEKYVNLEIAKLLKEKGFDEPCECFYDTEHNNISIVNGWMVTSNSQLDEREFLCYSAPTLQMTIDWLLEVHHYYIQVMLDSWACGEHMGYYVLIQRTDNDFEIMLSDFVDNVFYEKPEYAYNDAIKYILENLI